MEDVIKKVELLVKEKLANDASGHDWHHIQRVYRNAMHIQSKEGGDFKVVALGALLHDIADHKFHGGDYAIGGKVSQEILTHFQVDEDIKTKVVNIVKGISFKGAYVKEDILSLEGQIVQDADRLDAIGAIGIARTFAYGGSVGQPIFDPIISPKMHSTKEAYASGRTHTINHFYEKLLLLKDRMHTKTAIEMANERHAYMEQFLSQFMAEWVIPQKLS